MVEIVRSFDPKNLNFEYGLDGIRLLPWSGLNAPFGGAYCIVQPGSDSADHVNSPADEEELFIGIAGRAEVIVGDAEYRVGRGDLVFIPRGVRHFVRNAGAEPFHFYALWWNRQTAGDFLRIRATPASAHDWDI